MKIINCILVNFTVRQWDANSLDRALSLSIATESGVKDKSMCRLRKSLLPKSEVLSKLSTAIRAARTFHYENTHVWMHEGPRILTRGNYDAYMRQMLAYHAEFKTCVQEFCAQYPTLKESAKVALGELYRDDDYPKVESLASRYDFTITPLPLPMAESLLDFGLDPRETEELKSKLEAGMVGTFNRANKKMWGDLHNRLSRLSNKLNEEKGTVLEETIEGVRKLAELAPRMNLVGDSRLDIVAEGLRATLEGVTAIGLKVNPNLRERVAREAKQAVEAMETLMSASAGTVEGASDVAQETVGM